MLSYDYIIAGGGASGLSLAYRFCTGELSEKKILILDKSIKTENDRTWGFWKNRRFLFEDLITKKWDSIEVAAPDEVLSIPLNDYSYNVIRGIDFYNHVYNALKNYPNISITQAEIKTIRPTSQGAEVVTNIGEFEGRFVFNSCYDFNSLVIPSKYHFLKQHFKGWFIKTKEKTFDPSTARLFDFRTPQIDSFRFIYLLPFSENTALVEYTIFSEKLLQSEEYEIGILDYLKDAYKISDYEIEFEENGVIPMTSYPFSKSQSKHIINIGSIAGASKSSSGYTFLRIQEDLDALTESLLTTGWPVNRRKTQRRFELYDNILLSVLKKKKEKGYLEFVKMFEKNKIETIFKFLDEKSTLSEDLQIMRSMSSPLYIKSFFRESLKNFLR